MPWVIELYREGARVPVEEFLNALDPLGRDRVTAKIDLLGEMGIRLGSPHVKHLQGKLWELRVKRKATDSHFIFHREWAEHCTAPCLCEKGPSYSTPRD